MLICLLGPEGPLKQGFLKDLCLELHKSNLKVGVIGRDDDSPRGWGEGHSFIKITQGRLDITWPLDEEMGLRSLVERFLFDRDLVITTAHPRDPLAKIEYCPPGASPQFLQDPGLRALVCQDDQGIAKPVFSPGQVPELAQFIIGEMMPKREPDKARILLGGKKLPIKGFVQDMVADTIRAMVGSLKGGDRPGRLEIFLD